MFEVGARVGSYTIVAQLRTGGMATLYLARRSGPAGFSRLVAIKVVNARHSSDPRVVEMFLDEARLTARIEHPNVVYVEELGEIDGTYYLVMEYVHGCSLAQLAQTLSASKQRLSPLLAVAICARVAEGLHAAHETAGEDGWLLDIVHRDVNPQNILLSHRGHVKLIDFGVAKAKMGAEETNAASLKGTVRYMAPEQGSAGAIDRRTDIYALGTVLWELLTMRPFFAGKSDIEILKQVRRPDLVRPSRYAPEVPSALDRAVLRALAPERDDRFPNAKEMRRTLIASLPRAGNIDSSHIADLLASVMGDTLEPEGAELPDDISQVFYAEQLRVAGLEADDERRSSRTRDASVRESPPSGVGAYTIPALESGAEGYGARARDAPDSDAPTGLHRESSVRRSERTPTDSVEIFRQDAEHGSAGARRRRSPTRASIGLMYGIGLAISIGLGIALALWGPH